MISIVLNVIGLIDATILSLIIIIILAVIARSLKRTNSVANILSKQSERVKMILRQLELYSKLKVENELLKLERDQLLNEGNGVLHEVKLLDKIMGRFDVRINFLVGMLLNFLFAWDFQITNQFKKWLDHNSNQLEKWEEKLAEIEVWISGAIYKFNHPNSTFASINSDNNSIEIIGLSHPFVDQSKSVLNDVFLTEKENFIIITGPNMAGKSTYLRSLGLTFTFANAGFPILAKSCKLPLFKLFSSMRTSDDLTVESSYFHAELIRLRFIMDAIESGQKVFIILDEILKGTNSKDKEIGSAKFLQKLKRLQAKGIIATHDLSLCELSNNDESFRNMYFDSTINGENLSFDYKINQGVCKNMNASFLLKQMKLVD
jgi:DNA mismatch repair ATPase MutS